jgi:hypothetical protein
VNALLIIDECGMWKAEQRINSTVVDEDRQTDRNVSCLFVANNLYCTYDREVWEWTAGDGQTHHGQGRSPPLIAEDAQSQKTLPALEHHSSPHY